MPETSKATSHPSTEAAEAQQIGAKPKPAVQAMPPVPAAAPSKPTPPPVERLGVMLNPDVVAEDFRLGRRTQSVEFVQLVLRHQGKYKGQIDGIPGPQTQAAFKKHAAEVNATSLDQLGFDLTP